MLSGDKFAAVLKSRDRRRSNHFSLHWLQGAAPGGQAAAPASRLGLVVPKRRARTAVRRNLIKRHARALFLDWSRAQTAAAMDRRCAAVAAGGALDIVVKLTAPVARLDRAAQFAELGELMRALPRA